MSESTHLAEHSSGISNRRVHLRRQLRSVCYLELGDGNGGIVLSLSEGGLAFQAARSLTEGQMSCVRFLLPESRSRLESKGRIAWTSESRKIAGIEFVDLPDTCRNQIQEWISLGDSRIKPREQVAAPAEDIETPSMGLSSMEPAVTERVSEGPGAVPPSKGTSQVADRPARSATIFPDAPSKTAVQSVPAANPRSNWSLSPPREEQRNRKDSPRKVHTLSALFGFLAGLCLILGWAEEPKGLMWVFSRTNGQNFVTSPSTIPASRVSEIEIQDADKHSGRLASDAATIQQRTEQRQNAGEKTFQDTALSMPADSREASASVTAERETLPVPTNVPASSTDILPTPERLESRRLVSAPALQTQQPLQRVGVLQRGRLIRRVEPLYPAAALESGVEGTVKLHAVIAVDGSIKTLESVSGPDSLIDPAVNAVHQWRYTPTLLDDKPIETDQDIFIVFRLPQQ